MVSSIDFTYDDSTSQRQGQVRRLCGQIIQSNGLGRFDISHGTITRAPASDAMRFCVTTIPPALRVDGFLTVRLREIFGDSALVGSGMMVRSSGGSTVLWTANGDLRRAKVGDQGVEHGVGLL